MNQGVCDLMPPEGTRQALYAMLRGEGVPDGCPWDSVLGGARVQELLPDLYLALRPFASQVPAELWAGLRRAHQQAVARSLGAQAQLRTILAALAADGIEVAVLKGPAVAAYYPDQALRPFGDIDLLVRDEAVEAGCDTLRRLRYELERPTAWMRRHFNHLPALLPERGWPVELHWSLTAPGEPLTIPVEPLWGRLFELQTAGLGHLGLDPVDLAMYIVQHAFIHHRFATGLRAILDLGAISAGWQDQEWQALSRRAGSAGWRRCLALAFGLLRHILHQGGRGWGLPGWPAVGEAELAWGERLLWIMPQASVDITLAESTAQSGLWAKARRLLGYVFLPPEAMARTYKLEPRGPRLWLAYLGRPFDLLRRHGRELAGILGSDRVASELWREQRRVERWRAAIERPASVPREP